ncbi:phage portal protein [Rhizobium sp. SSA_523]|uniref:phage portal protein n=1 Tax=Rhizobium sp. SSA_523 TaxID=2952477 RepID=UPI002090BC80|nr:phage portal protein [Rhizobium sp. SSA_523]MCO5734118.1 phage portal protein [Rhizobium sp. SSA_523]WKC24755.1 phage portal protein [Rhizobium sp. SSA_523]
MTEPKPRHRVKATSERLQPAGQAERRGKPVARYLRSDRAGVLAMRKATMRDGHRDVREAAERAAALAIDFMHNSGWIAGAVTQVLCDTIGEELKLSCRAKLKKLGYSDKQAREWRSLVEEEWRKWAWNPKECDLAGKATIAEMADAVLRSFLGTGEAFGILDFMEARERRRYGLSTGIKVSLVASHRCPRITREAEGLDDGVFHDLNGRAMAYRFKVRTRGVESERDVDAADVIHVMDRGENVNSPRGISPIAPALKVLSQADQLADFTLAKALLQTVFAATINSPEPSEDAFKSLQTLEEIEQPEGWKDEESGSWTDFIGGLQQDLMDVWSMRVDALKEKGISMSDPARVNHLGPGETFTLHTTSTPNSDYLEFFRNLLREIARCIGVTYESLSMDHTDASYSSVLMSVASIWPIVLRRRNRIMIPFLQSIFERWLEEMIETGKIRIRGGVQAFRRFREDIFQAEWHGPGAPSADNYKAAMADKIELELGISSFFDICAKRGKNGQEQIDQLSREKKMFEDAGVPHPFGRTQGGGGPQGAAMEGNREPAKAA